MLAFSNDYYGLIFRATQSVELFSAYGIINARIAAMKYIIWEEKEKNRRVDYSELGVRVQSGNGFSDPT